MGRLIALMLVVFFVQLSCVLSLSAQSLSDLQRRKENTIKEINYTQKILLETGENADNSLSRLAILDRQIELRNRLISDYNYQISLLNNRIEDNSMAISLMTKDLQTIRNNYEKVIVNAFKNKGAYSRFYFVFSSESFNQAYKRMLYLRQITAYRKKQALQIEAIRFMLNEKRDDLVEVRKEKEELLYLKMNENDRLKKEEKNQEKLYANLQNRQRQLKKTLRQQQQEAEMLEKEIEKVIAEQARKARELAMSKDEKALTAAFAKNKGNFRWPVENGIITDRFGEHAHPIMKNILVRNNGVDISTAAQSNALAVYAGVVSKVFMIPGGKSAIILRHGKYLSVYSNLKEVVVKSGDVVEEHQLLGTIAPISANGNNALLKFQIWNENTKLNPEEWLSSK